MKTNLNFLFITLLTVQPAFSQQWNQMADGLENTGVGVWCMLIDGDDVYVGGEFTNAGGIPDADYIARWDGCAWHSVAPGISYPVGAKVYAIAKVGNDIYVGGVFNAPYTNIARWDGSQWHPLGNGFPDVVWTIAADGNTIYAGGGIVKKWNGNSWTQLGQAFNLVNKLTLYNGELYAGGSIPPVGIKKWNGSSWVNLGSGIPGIVWDMQPYNGELYVSGYFQNAGGNPDADIIAKWDGSNWNSLGPGLGDLYGPHALAITNESVFVSFGDGLDLPVGIMRWDMADQSWELFQTVQVNGIFEEEAIYSIEAVDSNLFISSKSSVMTINGISYGYTARWGAQADCPGCPVFNSSAIITSPLCFGSPNGSIDITPPTNGTLPYFYNWSNGATTEDIFGLLAGSYSLTIEDGSSCESAFSFVVPNPPELSIGISQQFISCFGDNDGSLTAIPSGGTPGYTYLWSNGANTNTISGLFAGIYTITVTDSHNCTKTSSAQIAEPPLLILNIISQDISCFGGANGTATAIASGGTPGYIFSWSNGGTTNTITNLNTGTYTVTITDINDCVQTGEVQIAQPLVLTLSTSAIGVTCFGNSNGSASANTSGGTPGYVYQWSNGASTSTINNLTAGTYTVTVTDANGCTKTNNVVVAGPPALILSVIGEDVSCYGGSDGSVSVTVTGGTSAYTYLWSNGSTADNIINVIAGDYSVTVTDNAGCTSAGIYTIESPTELDVIVSVIDISAPGEEDGSASAVVNGGTPGYNYLWSTGDTTISIENLAAGNYSLTVTDINGCSEEIFFTVSAPDCGLLLSIITSPITCNGSQDGTASAEYSGGNGNIEFQWSTGETSQTINNLGAGTYSVTITDGSCIVFGYASLMDPPAIDAQITSMPADCNEANGSASVMANGGTGTLFYLWSNGETNNEIDSLNAGVYSVTVSDSNICTVSMSIEIITIDSIAPGLIHLQDTLFVDSSGTIDDFTSLVDNFLDNCGVFTYEVLNAGDLICGQQTADTLDVFVTDLSWNDTVYSLVITLLDTFPPLIISCPDNIEQGTCQGVVIFNEPIVSDNCQLTSVIQIAGLQSGSEFPVGTTVNRWIATDNSGNTQQCSNTVIISEGFVLETNVQPITCHNQNDGLITIDTSNLTPPFFIVWSTGDTTSTLGDLDEGYYTVMVTDDQGCQVLDTFILSNPESLFASLQEKHDASSADSTDGSIFINVSGGTPPYSYEWYHEDSLVSNVQNPVSLGPGLYILFLMDAHECLFVGLYVEIGVITGSIEIINSGIKVLPNPTKDILFIESSDKIQSLWLYDISGEMLEVQNDINATTTQVDVADKHPGWYALVIVSGDRSEKIQRKLIIKAE